MTFHVHGSSTRKQTQYYEMVGTRGIWHQGWKAATEHGPMPSNLGHFDKDGWVITRQLPQNHEPTEVVLKPTAV